MGRAVRAELVNKSLQKGDIPQEAAKKGIFYFDIFLGFEDIY